MLEAILGPLVAILGPSALVIGGIAQIRLNRSLGRCGQPWEMILLVLLFHMTNTFYGLAIGKWPVYLTSAIGVLIWDVIALQYLTDRLKPRE